MWTALGSNWQPHFIRRQQKYHHHHEQQQQQNNNLVLLQLFNFGHYIQHPIF